MRIDEFSQESAEKRRERRDDCYLSIKKTYFTCLCTLVFDVMSNTLYQEPSDYVNRIGDKVVDAAFQVHKRWGPGLLEHFYHRALYNELKMRGLKVESEVYLPITLDGEIIEGAYKMDLLVEDEVIIELKAVENLTPTHFQQIRTYLKVSNKQLGYLINFNKALIMDGINRQVMSPRE